MNGLVRIGCAIALFSSVALGVSQAQPQQQQQRQNQRMQRMSSAMMQSALDALSASSDPLQLIFVKAVQLDMGLDLGQRNKLDNLHDRQQAELLRARRAGRGNNSAVTDLQTKQRKETQDKIDELLTADQKARLQQIVYQAQGNFAVTSPSMQKQLAIDDEQLSRIRTIQSWREQQIAQLQVSLVQGAVLPQDINTELNQIQTDANSQIGEVLTDEQKDQLKKLMGKPYKH